MPVPSGAVPTEAKDGWSFAGADELDVKSLAGGEEELESVSSEYPNLGQQRQEMRLVKNRGQAGGYNVPASIEGYFAQSRGWCTSVRRRRRIGNKQRMAGSSPSPVRRRRLLPMYSVSKSGSIIENSEQLTSWTGYHQWSGQCYDE